MKNIDQLFQDSSQNLERNPSSDTWNRLEQKLDGNSPKNKPKNIQLIWSVAASIAVIIGVFALLNKSALVSNVEEKPQLEDLRANTEYNEYFEEAVAYHIKMAAKKDNGLEEGNYPGRRIVVKGQAM